MQVITESRDEAGTPQTVSFPGMKNLGMEKICGWKGAGAMRLQVKNRFSKSARTTYPVMSQHCRQIHPFRVWQESLQ